MLRVHWIGSLTKSGVYTNYGSMSVMGILRQLTVCFALWLVAITIRRDQRH